MARARWVPAPGDEELTQVFAPIVLDDDEGDDDRGRSPSLGRSSSRIALASLVSRATGFLRQVLLVSVLGVSLVNSSYTIANTLPNIVYESLIGGVLSAVLIPLLVRAQKEDPDGGDRYTRRLLTLAGTALVLATAVAVLAAPLLTALYIGEGADPAAQPLTTALAYLLLPQIFFYGIGAILGAILNSRQVFGPFAWAPVVNNIVVLAVLGVFLLVPGEISTDPVRMGEPKLLVLGIGTTLGIVAQAVVLLPAIRRVGFRFRPDFGWDPRLSQARRLAGWVVGYVLIGQLGLVVTQRVAIAADPAGPAVYTNAWLLLQVPYGILGVSLLTALMPRMSRAAADGRTADVVADLSLGSRLSAVFLLPVSALITVFGGPIAAALFAYSPENEAGAAQIGAALSVSAFGLLPFAITMLQIRVFYALTDSRTPALIQLVTIGVKIPLLLLCGALLPSSQVVLGLAAVNALSVPGGGRRRPGAAAPPARRGARRRRAVDDGVGHRRLAARGARRVRRGDAAADPGRLARPPAGLDGAGGRARRRRPGDAHRDAPAAGAGGRSGGRPDPPAHRTAERWSLIPPRAVGCPWGVRGTGGGGPGGGSGVTERERADRPHRCRAGTSGGGR
jgi:putative peptidoglycan lipid II flippase